MIPSLSTFEKKCDLTPKKWSQNAKNDPKSPDFGHFRYVGDKKIAIEEGAILAILAISTKKFF